MINIFQLFNYSIFYRHRSISVVILNVWRGRLKEHTHTRAQKKEGEKITAGTRNSPRQPT